MSSKKEIQDWLETYNIKNFSINDDLTIDVNDNVILNGLQLTCLPYKFNYVAGQFTIFGNQLTSLKNTPSIIDGDFVCAQNLLLDLSHAPQKVGESFYCSDNPFRELHGVAIHFTEHFYHCTKDETEFLKEFIDYYEIDHNFGFSIELPFDTFQMACEKYQLEKNIISHSLSTKIKI